jgi:dTDP-4-dehydrorhamnose 3,5-epimerase-like enzyme
MSSGKMLSEVRELEFPSLGDERGELIALEQNQHVPFDIKRVYYIIRTEQGVKRGFHAHIALEQVAVAVTGSCVFDVETFEGKSSYTLDSAYKGLYLGGLVWREMRDFTEDCVLMVLASDVYTEDDYLRDYAKFKDALSQNEF